MIQGGQGYRRVVPKFYLAVCLSFLLALSSSPVSAFTIISNAGQPAYWESNEVSFVLKDVPSEFEAAIEQSFFNWTNVPGVGLNVFNLGTTNNAPDEEDGVNTVSWIDSNWESLPFFPSENVLAVTLSTFDDNNGKIVDADIYVNAEFFEWDNLDEEFDSGVDVENVMTHEVGHLLGLDHSSEDFYEANFNLRDATMFFTSGEGEIRRRSLESDDMKGIQSLYPELEPEAPLIDSVELISNNSSEMRIRFIGQNFNDRTSFILSANRTFIFDRVARYKTIVSSTEAEVEFNVSNWRISNSSLIAANSPFQLSKVDVDLSSEEFSVSDGSLEGASQIQRASSSGGGCMLGVHKNQGWFLWILAFSLILTLVFRRRAS